MTFLLSCLRNEGIEFRLVKRREYDEETVRWADAIIAAGGKNFTEIKMLEFGNVNAFIHIFSSTLWAI